MHVLHRDKKRKGKMEITGESHDVSRACMLHTEAGKLTSKLVYKNDFSSCTTVQLCIGALYAVIIR
jgi:hypothetical protein